MLISILRLMLAKELWAAGDDMFSSTIHRLRGFQAGYDELGAIINLDDITHIDFLERLWAICRKRSVAVTIPAEFSV